MPDIEREATSSSRSLEEASMGIDASRAERARAHQAAVWDVFIAFVMFAIILSLLVFIDFFEWFFEYSRAHEAWELDELAASIPAAAIVLAWLAIRRWCQATRLAHQLEENIDALLDASQRLALARTKEKQASEVKSAFLSMMGDELRTPLNGVVSPVEALLETNLDAGQEVLARQALRSSTSVVRSINDILELAALEMEPGSPDLQNFDVGDLFDDILQYTAHHAHSSVELVLLVDPVLPSTLSGDRRLLFQALSGFLHNACKFTQTGAIAVSARLETRPGEGLFIRFEVSDTGPGIEPEQMGSVFDNFTKFTPLSGEEHPGSGIGLAITQKLVRSMRGKTGVNSEPGTGSTFWFAIPLPHTSEPLQVDADTLLDNLRVLIIDDAELVRRTLAEQVAGWGAEVETAALWVEAAATLRTAAERDTPFDVVLLERSGSERLFAQVRKDPRLEQVKIVLLDPDHRHPSTTVDPEVEVFANLRKPVLPSVLGNCLRRISTED